MKIRLDQLLVKHSLVATRSQAGSQIRLGKVSVNGRVITKPEYFVSEKDEIQLADEEQFVSRAALKLRSVADKMKLDFRGKVILDVGSSTGGFTDFSLSRGAKKVIAVEVGTDQLHPKLRRNPRVELHEKTDIRSVVCHSGLDPESSGKEVAKGDKKFNWILNQVQDDNATVHDDKVVISETPDIILIDVSFISLREILPHIAKNLAGENTQIVAMLKPQFETGAKAKHDGVIKNETARRKIIKDFELWTRLLFLIQEKKDSEVSGATGNRERFYLLKKIV